jgi:hypothetical protein
MVLEGRLGEIVLYKGLNHLIKGIYNKGQAVTVLLFKYQIIPQGFIYSLTERSRYFTLLQ